MEINGIIEQANDLAVAYNLQFVEIDRTDSVVKLRLLIDNELFIQIYGNAEKEKLNLTLVFKNSRLYGYDFEGGKYHFHPFDNPDDHLFINDLKSIESFVLESLKYLYEKGLL